MKTARFTDAVKTRIPREMRLGLDRVAKACHLDTSDIQRQAFREFLERNAANGHKKKTT